MEKGNIYAKILNVKEEVGKLSKSKKNAFFKSSYLDLNDLIEAVEPLLHKNKLILLQPILDGHVCTEIIDTESEDMIESKIALPVLSDPQKLGSAITYFRRYTLQSLLGLQAVDDDGEGAKHKPKAKTELPPCDDITFDKYVKAIAEETKDKQGVIIDKEYLRKKHTLNSAQESALLLIQLEQ